MRRAIAHSLWIIFSWLLTAPMLVPGGEASLPACCRRAGKHHCMMGAAQLVGANDARFASVSEKCPCIPDSTGVVHAVRYKPEPAARFYAEVVFRPAYAPQTSARFRISFLHSHQRRGPPSPLM